MTTDPQGESVVSARELHQFLRVKTRFATWIERRISEFGFIEHRDFSILTTPTESTLAPNTASENEGGVFPKFGKNPLGGRPELDYALTLDMAKELSMVERTERGKQARQYFIDCEKHLRQLATQPLGPTQHLWLGQSQRITELEQKLEQVLTAQQQAARAMLEIPLSGESVPLETTRIKIQRLVNGYCQATGLAQQDVWRKVYDRLYYAYRISIRRHKKRTERESWLDVAERNGYLEKIYAIVSNDFGQTQAA